ncbi:hypothetical protein RHGRI_004216 [Rhododendron griersonianum]|uniref:Uncharacterized protein n=1 Tax=Rhododendron griersonianum TaxID=479676 RepID=A0AAV6LAI3_9ERIC|nr:hypothetical protein RHGRI_004216 [Rhododendron griersonianum]
MAYGILQARALPRDVKAAPTDANDLISEIVQYLVLAGIRTLCLQGDIAKRSVAMRDMDDALANEHDQARLAREAASQHQNNFQRSQEQRKVAELRA